MAEQCADQVAHQIGGAEVHHVAGGKPLGLNQRWYQRRVGKTRQTNTDQAGAETGEDRQPDRAAPSVEGGAVHGSGPVNLCLASSISRNAGAILQRFRATMMRICITAGNAMNWDDARV